MKIKSGTLDQGWELVDRLDHDNVKSHPFSGKGADLTINLIAKQGAQVIGGVAASSDDYGIGYLEMLWVDPMFRRQGIGQALLVAVEQALFKAGCCKVRLETFDYQAPAFYRANQYQVALYPCSVDRILFCQTIAVASITSIASDLYVSLRG